MTTACRSSSAAEALSPVRASYVNLYKWPESDVDFVRSFTGVDRARRSTGRRKLVPGRPTVSDSYSCRQMYLRSYVFTPKKETVPERTRRCLIRLKTRATQFPLLKDRTRDDGSQLYDQKMKNKGCGTVAVRKLKSVLRRFFSCATGGR